MRIRSFQHLQPRPEVVVVGASWSSRRQGLGQAYFCRCGRNRAFGCDWSDDAARPEVCMTTRSRYRLSKPLGDGNANMN